MQEIFEHDFVSIKYYPEHQLLYLTWEGYITSEDYVKIMRQMLEFTRRLQVARWISDARHSDEIQMGDMSWTMKHMYEFLKGSSLRKIARVIKPGNTSQLYLNQLIHSEKFLNQEQVQFQVFNSIEEAWRWALLPSEKTAFT